MEDQISKLKGNIKVVKAIENSAAVKDLQLPLQILFAHPEDPFTKQTNLLQHFKIKNIQRTSESDSLDEAHLAVEW